MSRKTPEEREYSMLGLLERIADATEAICERMPEREDPGAPLPERRELLDLKQLHRQLQEAAVDKSDLFDFYNGNWSRLVEEIRWLRKQVRR